jgi:hypothetical protein
LPLVSTTPAVPVAKFAAGVIDTSAKFATAVVDTGKMIHEKNLRQKKIS